MAASRPILGDHRDYPGSLEEINGIVPAADQKLSADELNTSIVRVIESHADLLDSSELKWHEGFTLSNTWALDDDGRKVSYYATINATPLQIASVIPGTDENVWLLSDSEYIDALVAAQAATDKVLLQVSTPKWSGLTTDERSALTAGSPVQGADFVTYKLTSNAIGSNLGPVADTTERDALSPNHGDYAARTNNSGFIDWYNSVTSAWVATTSTNLPVVPANGLLTPAPGVTSWSEVGALTTDQALKLEALPAPSASLTITDRYGETVGGSGVFIVGQTVTVNFSGSVSETAVAASNGAWSMTVPAGATEGTITASATSTYGDSLTASATYLLVPNGTGSPLEISATQTVIDNGYTLPSGVSNVNTTVLTVDEAGGLAQTYGTDYTITGKLLEFNGALKISLQAGVNNSTPYTTRLNWS